MTKTITTKMIRLLVRQHGLKTILRLMSEMAYDASDKHTDNRIKHKEYLDSPWSEYAKTLIQAAEQLPDEPFWEG